MILYFQAKEEISDYFDQFGVIESVKIWKKYAFVQFDSVNAVAKALATHVHIIKRRYVTCKAADRVLQSDGSWHDTQTAPILTILNNDCLLNIFKRLDLLDLTNVAATCVRFNQQANELIKSHFWHLNLRDFDKEAIVRLLNNFSSLIPSVQSIEISRADSIALQMINQEFKQFTITSLSLESVECDFNDVRSLFAQLQTLKLKDCKFNNFPNDLKLWLKHLEVDWGRVDTKLSYNDILLHWIKICPKLKKLSIKNHLGTYWEILLLISENAKQLQSLEYLTSVNNLFDGERIHGHFHFHYLTELKLQFNGSSIHPLVHALAENKIPIEHLKIIRGEINEDGINSLTRLERLEVLELFRCVNWSDDHLNLLANKMPNLRELHLFSGSHHMSITGLKQMIKCANKLTLLTLKRIYNICIGIDDYMDILAAIQMRPEMKRLVIEVPRHTIPNETIKANYDTLQIKGKFYNI